MSRRAAHWLTALLACGLDACDGGECDPGEQRACAQALDGGSTQRGYQACGAQGTWSTCFAVGACTPSGASLPVYSRCATSEQCGSASCAVCRSNTGVQNPEAFSACYAFCQGDADCAPAAPAADVTPRCLLGQCALLCRSGATCPRDTRCLPWNTAALASAYAGYQGLCQ